MAQLNSFRVSLMLWSEMQSRRQTIQDHETILSIQVIDSFLLSSLELGMKLNQTLQVRKLKGGETESIDLATSQCAQAASGQCSRNGRPAACCAGRGATRSTSEWGSHRETRAIPCAAQCCQRRPVTRRARDTSPSLWSLALGLARRSLPTQGGTVYIPG
jgi:hypothetical protein